MCLSEQGSEAQALVLSAPPKRGEGLTRLACDKRRTSEPPALALELQLLVLFVLFVLVLGRHFGRFARLDRCLLGVYGVRVVRVLLGLKGSRAQLELAAFGLASHPEELALAGHRCVQLRTLLVEVAHQDGEEEVQDHKVPKDHHLRDF